MRPPRAHPREAVRNIALVFAPSTLAALMPRIDREVAVLGTGSAMPERRVTNEELRSIVRNYDPASGDFAVWVDRVTHIQERRFIDPARENTGTLGLTATRHALEAAKLRPQDIDHVVF